VAPDAAFVKVNCAGNSRLSPGSELFGYEKGAFTGAYSAKAGRVEQAHEARYSSMASMKIDMSLQAKLLQLLQDGQFSRIGGQETCTLNCALSARRIVIWSRKSFNGRFRQDLFYRINVVNIQLPSLGHAVEISSAWLPIFSTHIRTRTTFRYGRSRLR